jgi:WD40 repeat protein
MKSIRILAAAAAALTLAGLAPAVAASAATPSATQQWAKGFGIKGGDNYDQAIATSPDGNTVYVAGSSKYGELAAYHAATGALDWKHTVKGGVGYLRSDVTSVAVSPDGSTVFVGGYGQTSRDGSESFYQLIAAYNAATGAKLWQLTGTTVTGASPAQVTVSPDSSTVYVTNEGLDQTAAYHAATGTAVWTEPTGGTALVLSSGGTTLYITGDSAGGTEALAASTGATDWQSTVSGTAEALSPDGTTLYVCDGQAAGSSASVVTTAIDSGTGSGLWSAGTGLSGDRGQVNGVAATGSAVIVNASLTNAAGDRVHWLTAGLNSATGAGLWTAGQYGTYVGAFASGLVLNPDASTAYVTGWVSNVGAGDGHIVTIGYDTGTGAKTWTASYYGQTQSYAYTIGISPDGSQIFVGGTITLAYSTS